MMSFEGRFKYQDHENYEEFLKLLDFGWFKRKRALFFCPILTINENPRGTLHFKGDCCKEKIVVLGEEHQEIMPNGEAAEALTVREGDDCLITRLKAPWNLEIRREFTPKAMTQFIRHLESDMEAIRYFKRLN